MRAAATHFEILYNLAVVQVEQSSEDIYQLTFPNEVPPVTIRSKLLDNGRYDWDTVPPGNKEMATSFGKLIEEHLNVTINHS